MFLLCLFLVTNDQVFAANKFTDSELEQIQSPSISINVITPEKQEAKEIYYKLENLYTNEIVFSGTSDNGKIKIKVKPSVEEKKYLNILPIKDLNVQNIKYALRVFDFNGNMKNFYFDVPVIKDKNKLDIYKITQLKSSKLNEDLTVTLVPVNKRVVEKSSNVVSSDKVKLMSDRVSIMGEWIMESYDYTSPTIVGYVSSMPGFKNTFQFVTNSDVKIDVMVNYGSGWQIDGSLTNSSFTTTTHVLTDPSSAKTVEAKDNFRYRWARKFDDYTGYEWEEIYPLYHIGSYGWGNSVSPGYNNKASSSVQAGFYGNWFIITPTNYTDRSSKNGTRFSAAATVKGVSVGLSTQYENESKYAFRSNNGDTFYVYDYDSSLKKWYVTK